MNGSSSYNGIHYRLRPSYDYVGSGGLVTYDIRHEVEIGGPEYTYHSDEVMNLSELAGSKLLWNIYTQPNLTAGAAVIPDSSTSSRQIGNDDIVPYIEYSGHREFKLSFVNFGDIDTKMQEPEISNIRVYRGYYEDTEEYQHISAIYTADSFSGEPQTFYSDYETPIIVRYEKDNALYTWTFRTGEQNYSEIDWGELDPEKQPVRIKAGESKDFTVTLPGNCPAEAPKSVQLSIGNHELLDFIYDDEGKPAIGYNSEVNKSQWEGSKWIEGKNSFWFSIIGLETGKTTLCIDIPFANEDGQPAYKYKFTIRQLLKV